MCIPIDTVINEIVNSDDVIELISDTFLFLMSQDCTWDVFNENFVENNVDLYDDEMDVYSDETFFDYDEIDVNHFEMDVNYEMDVYSDETFVDHEMDVNHEMDFYSDSFEVDLFCYESMPAEEMLNTP